MSFRLVIIASTIFAGMSGAALAQMPMQMNTDLPGGNFRSFRISGNETNCLSLCARDLKCRAWSYHKPMTHRRIALCFLKNSVPMAVASDCCTSGVIKRVIID